MHHPYQCLSICRPDDQGATYLLAASGPTLYCVNLSDGTIASKWAPQSIEKSTEVDDSDQTGRDEGPPPKKRRLSMIKAQESSPNIISLTLSKDQQYVIAVTGEDKCVRVFSVSPDGQLDHLSARAMPKRPCAIATTLEDQDVLVADKFGDVYSIPLLLDPENETAFVLAQKAAAEEKASYTPSATELTVHSRANRRALEAQLQQAKAKLVAKTKEPLAFSHKLLLGHVSMLTDMLFATAKSSEDDEKLRTYILTSDRDEHIRLSRGPPQAYVIEGYCLGHHEFVNRLCVVDRDLLVSGGGDTGLFVWDWLQQKLLNCINLVEAAKRALLHVAEHGGPSGYTTADETTEKIRTVVRQEMKIAVSGLWCFADSSLKVEPQLLIACEGIPAILHIPVAALRSDDAVSSISFIPLDGNALDIGFSGNSLIISCDNLHEAASTSAIDASEDFRPRLQAYEALGEELGGGAVFKRSDKLNHALTDLNEQHTTEWHERALRALLYNVENLRKRPGADDSGSVAE